MKTYRFFTAILMVALCFNLVSCGDDENESGITNNSEKRLIKIELYEAYNQNNHEYCGDIKYEYDGNKISRIISSIYDEYNTYEIGEKEITVWDTEKNEISSTYTLNDNGYIQSSTLGIKYNYYSDGYLKSLESGNEIYVYSYDKEWNLIKTSDIPNILYTDKIQNKGNLFIWDGLAGSGRPDIDILASVGFFGKTPKYLLQRFDYGDNDSDLYEYELDKDGYVEQTRITIDNQSFVYKYTYENTK